MTNCVKSQNIILLEATEDEILYKVVYSKTRIEEDCLCEFLM